MTRPVIGIDPGQDGGLAFIEGARVEAIAMPVAGKEIDWRAFSEWLSVLVLGRDDAVAYVEKVGAMPKQGVSSTFKFGRNVGGIYGALAALGISAMQVTPPAWKKVVLAGTPKDKAAAIAFCRRRWPRVSLLASPRCRVAHDGMADALCIAEFGRLKEAGLRARV